jgi:hypothetical protein
VQYRRLAKICGQERAAGSRIIVTRRSSSTHLHRPWRASPRQSTLSPTRSADPARALPLLCGRPSHAFAAVQSAVPPECPTRGAASRPFSSCERVFWSECRTRAGASRAGDQDPPGYSPRLHPITNRIDRVGRFDRPAVALVVLDNQRKEIEAVGFRRARFRFVFEVSFNLLERSRPRSELDGSLFSP